MGAGRRSIKLSNLSAAAPAEQEKPEVTETPAAVTEEPAETKPAVETTAVEATAVETEGLNQEPMTTEEETEIVGEIFAAVTEPTFAEAISEATAAVEADVPKEEIKTEPLEEAINEIVESNENIGQAIAQVEYTEAQYEKPEPLRDAVVVSDEVGIIARDTKIHGDIVTDGHLEINGVVEGSINARGNVRINGDVYGDITCGNLIIKEGVLKINVHAREDIALGEKARIEGDINCRKIGIEGTVVGNVTALKTVQIAPSAVVYGNIKTTGIAIGMGAKVTGNISMGE